jgi:putative membrane protein
VVIFGLAAWLIEGFRLRWGVISAIIGAIALAIVNSILSWVLQSIGLIAA